MTQPVEPVEAEVTDVDFDAIGFAPAGCAECGCAAESFHYSGCSFAPMVCPGCYAMNGAPCASDCIDAAIERSFQELPDWTDPANDFGDTYDGEGDFEWEP